MTARSRSVLCVNWENLPYRAFWFWVFTFALIPVTVSGSWNEVDAILQEAYGEHAVRECRHLYESLDLAEDQAAAAREGIAVLVKAGYPSGCPKEYLKLVARLTRAGIQLDDLTNKIREGVAKKVSPQRLTTVITRRAEALLEARVITLKLVEEKVEFLDRQMAYSVIGDYLLRGVRTQEFMTDVLEGHLSRYPALENLIR